MLPLKAEAAPLESWVEPSAKEDELLANVFNPLATELDPSFTLDNPLVNLLKPFYKSEAPLESFCKPPIAAFIPVAKLFNPLDCPSAILSRVPAIVLNLFATPE